MEIVGGFKYVIYLWERNASFYKYRYQFMHLNLFTMGAYMKVFRFTAPIQENS